MSWLWVWFGAGCGVRREGEGCFGGELRMLENEFGGFCDKISWNDSHVITWAMCVITRLAFGEMKAEVGCGI